MNPYRLILISAFLIPPLWTLQPALGETSPVPKTELRVGALSSDPAGLSGLTPKANTDVKLIHIQVSDPIVYIDEEGQIKPALATSLEQLEPTLWKFQLRKGVKFHNGEPFDAQSMVYSFNQYIRFPTYLQPTQFGNIQTLAADERDPLVLLIRLKRPSQIILKSLTYLIPLPPKYLEEKGVAYFQEHPIGTGPYEFVSWEHGKSILFRKNPNYWDPARPKTDFLRFVITPQLGDLKSLQDGKVDIHLRMDGRNTLKLLDSESGEFKIQKRLVLFQNAIILGRDGPLQSKDVRIALNLALNKEEMIKYADYGNAVILASLAAKGSVGHDPTLTPYPFDPERAKALLKKAGYPNGFKLRGAAVQDSQILANIVQNQLKQIGVTLETKLIGAYADVFDLLAESSTRPGFFLFRYGNSLIDLSHFAGIWYSPTSVIPFFSDPIIEEKLTAALRANTKKDYERRLQELDRYAHDEAITLFTTQRILTVGARKNVFFKIPLSGSYNTSSLISEIELRNP